MIGTFFDGLDVLYHHAKFGEDLTTHAGCKCENMLVVCFYWQDAAKRQTAGIKFTHRPKIRFFLPRRGDSLNRFTSNLAWPTLTDTWTRLAVQNFISIGALGWEYGPKISKISTVW